MQSFISFTPSSISVDYLNQILSSDGIDVQGYDSKFIATKVIHFYIIKIVTEESDSDETN